MRVSVVVPVYNTGPYLADLVASLRAQTMDAGDFEVIFVDDGSTDGTAGVLDAIAAETANMHVIHTPNSGWPGRPRNIGIEAARGDYVFLSDHDDRLDPEALTRLTAFADEHASDVVVGRIVGVGRSAPTRIFARTVVDAQDDPALLMTSLTPQKLYRRSFLDARGIRFPEGRRRLEDHLFVTKAYVRAARVSIYADHPVYYFVLRDDGQNASRSRIEWPGYYRNAAEAIAVVDEEVEDPQRRLVMRRRWLRTEALGRLRGQGFLNRGEDRPALVAAVRDLLRGHYPLSEVDLLGPCDRVVARLALAGDEAGLEAFARWEASIRARPRLEAVALDRRSGCLELRFRVDQRATHPRPDLLADPPEGWPRPAELDAVERMAASSRVSVAFRQAGSGLAVPMTVQQTVEAGCLSVVATLDPRGEPTILRDGRWSVQTRFRGLSDRVKGDDLLVPQGEKVAVEEQRYRIDGHLLHLSVGQAGRLSLRVTTPTVQGFAERIRRSALRRLGLRTA